MASGLLLDQDVDDLASVSFVDEALIVAILRCRFRKQKVFVSFVLCTTIDYHDFWFILLFLQTSVGDILISVNPFELISKKAKCPVSFDCKLRRSI